MPTKRVKLAPKRIAISAAAAAAWRAGNFHELNQLLGVGPHQISPFDAHLVHVDASQWYVASQPRALELREALIAAAGPPGRMDPPWPAAGATAMTTNGAQWPPASATAQQRLSAMAAEVVALRGRNYEPDDLADRGLVRSLIYDLRDELDGLERRLKLRPIEFDDDRRHRAHRNA